MFALIESGPRHCSGADWPSRVASFALHALLTAAAVVATRGALHVVTYVPTVDPSVVWQAPPRPPAPAPAPIAGAPSATVSLPTAWVAPSVVPIDIPPPDSAGGWVPGPGSDPPPGPGAAFPPGAPTGTGTAPIEARWAEELPMLLSHSAPRYPEVLRQAGIEGRVMVEAVIDTLGRAELSSLRVLTSAHALFDREAMAVVLGSRYRPGRAAGRAVRVRVQVPVSFTIRR